LGWQTNEVGGDEVMALLAASVWEGMAQYVATQLGEAAEAENTLADAASAVEDQWEADLLIASRAQFLALTDTPGVDNVAGLQFIPCRYVTNPLIVASSGIWLAATDVINMNVTEPRIGGIELSAVGAVAISIGENAVVQVGAE